MRSALLLLAFSASAHAAYKCEVEGKTMYQDRPCLAGKQVEVPSPVKQKLVQQDDVVDRRKRVNEALATLQVGDYFGEVMSKADRRWAEMPEDVNTIYFKGGSTTRYVFPEGTRVTVRNGIVELIHR